MTRPSPALVATWYARLRAAGFRDIEGGRDLNRLHTWTFPGGDGPGSVQQLVDGLEPRLALADHPTAVYHRELEHAARVLKGRQRQLVMVASSATAARAGGRMNVPRRTAAHQVRRFAISVGLVREAHGS